MTEGQDLEKLILAIDGEVHTAVEVECFSRPGRLVLVQMIRCR